MKIQPWEYWLGRPRASRFAVGLVLAIALIIGVLVVAERYGALIPQVVVQNVSLAILALALVVVGSLSLYGLLASVILLCPVWLLFVVSPLREVEKEPWFWVVVTFSTVFGGMGFIRYSRVWKFYKSQEHRTSV